MRKLLVVMVVLVAASLAAQSPQGAMVATDITAAEVQAFLKDAPHDRNSDRPMRVVDAGGYRVGIYGVYRPKNLAPAALIHETKVAEVYYMLDGAGTLITGGKLKEPTMPRPSTIGTWTDVGSSGIDGGITRRVAKGDVVIIPGGLPHMWGPLEGDSITYLIVRPDPEKNLTLK